MENEYESDVGETLKWQWGNLGNFSAGWSRFPSTGISRLESTYPWYCGHLFTSVSCLLWTHHCSLIMRKTSGRSQEGGILQCTWPIPFMLSRSLQNKVSLRQLSENPEELKENIMTKRNVGSWRAPWNRKRTLGKNQRNMKKRWALGLIIMSKYWFTNWQMHPINVGC